MKTLFLAILLVVSTHAFADNCDKPRDDFDGLYCLNKVYMQADADLNVSYKALRKQLNPGEQQILKKGQLKWINYRNENCSFKKDGSFWVNLGCAKKTTVDRTNLLNDRIRECKATGCQPSKL